MKKRILTITMCFTLLSPAAFAENQNSLNATKTLVPTQAKSSLTPAQTAAKKNEQLEMRLRQDARKMYADRKAKERELMYAALGFTAEQKAKAVALDSQSRAEIGKLIKKLQVESKQFRELKVKKASSFAVWKQEKAVKKAKNNLDKYMQKSKESFDAIMTPEQKAKYDVMREAKKKEMRELIKGKYMDQEGKRRGPKGPKPPRGPEFMGPPMGVEPDFTKAPKTLD